MDAHTAGTHVAPAAAPAPATRRRGPKVDRPEITDSMDEESWNAMETSWRMYARVEGIVDDDKAAQLYCCCKRSLQAKITAVHPDFMDRPVDELLPLIKMLTVIPVAKTVKQNELLQMKQDPGQSIRDYHSRVKAKAMTCHFKKRCTHPHRPPAPGAPEPVHVDVDYTNEMIRHVIMNGIYDEEIRRDIFGDARIDEMEVTEPFTLIESKEMARDATGCGTNNSISGYRKLSRKQQQQQQQQQKQQQQPQ